MLSFYIWCGVEVQLHPLACEYCFPSTICWRHYSLPIEQSGAPLLESTDHRYRLLSELSTLFHWSVCPSFMPIPHCLINVTSCKVWNKKYKSSNFLFFFQDCFGYSGSPAVSLWILDFCKKAIGILKGTAWNLQTVLGNTVILTSSLPIQEYRISFHLLRSYLISFSNIL